jgi:hypothetical protein
MQDNSLLFNNAKIEGIVTVTGDKEIDFLSTYSDYNLSEKDAQASKQLLIYVSKLLKNFLKACG